VAERARATVVVARISYPLASSDEARDAVLAAVTPRTRLVLVDHVTSPTGLVFPLRRLVAALAAAGVDVLVDGAHAPGMLPLDLGGLEAAYYVGNCHKWLCAPKGAGFLVVRRDRQASLVPLSISHGWNAPPDRSLFRRLFDWGGTVDPTAWLSVPAALRVVGGLLPGGWPAVMARNHALALEARALMAGALGVAPPAPEASLGSLVAFPLGPGDAAALQRDLLERERIEIPVFPFGGQRVIRLSAAIYTDLRDARRLAEALPRALARGG
jgi:isopenicillin-N epimerase